MKPHAVISAARRLQVALDVLVVALLVVAVVGAWHEPVGRLVVGQAGHRGGALALALAFGAVYAAGRARVVVRDQAVDEPRGAWWPAGAWITALVLLWACLLAVAPGALWLAFPLMFLEMHVLGPRRGGIAVAVTTLVAVVGALAAGQGPTGSVLGPVIGALVAVTVVLGLETVVREAQRRQVLVEELVEAREHLAASERERLVVAERERLAREIHDTLAQGFSSIELLLRAADRSLADGDGATARGYVAQSRAAAQENLAEARRVVRALAPADLETGTLVAALERVARRAQELGGPAVEVRVSGQAYGLPVPVETALLRVAQSAVANAVQHADGASHVAVTVSYLGDAVALDVVDDGAGFDAQDALTGDRATRGARSARAAGAAGAVRTAVEGGFGLVVMRSRVAELGGSLSVESERGRGSAVAVHLPLPEREAGR